jgi:hypothetical protein
MIRAGWDFMGVNLGFRLEKVGASKISNFESPRVGFMFEFGRDLLHWLRLGVKC